MSKKKNNISLFTVSFKQGFVSPNIPIATFRQGDKKINFLLDTGSDNNVIDAAALKEFKHTKVEEGAPVNNLTGVGGTQQVSMCSLSFSCDNEEYTQEFLVTDMKHAFDMIENDHCIKIHGILGSVFLRENNVVLDFQNLAAYSRK